MAETERRHTLLVISELEELKSGEGFPEVFREFCAGRFELVQASLMDVFMRPLPAGISASILNIWRFTSLHRDLLEKLLGETGRPVIVHLTDDRPQVRAFLDATPGVTRVKKPASLQSMREIVEAAVAGGFGAAHHADPDAGPEPGAASSP